MIADRKNALELLSGCLLELGLWLVAGALCVVGTVLGALIGGAVTPESGGPALGGLAGGMSCAMIGILVIGAWIIVKQANRGRRADAMFAALGLPARAYYWRGRQAHGSIHGRQVDVYVAPQGMALQLEWYVASAARTRLSLALKGALGHAAAKAMKPEWLTLTQSPDLNHLLATPFDPDWARVLLADESARAAIAKLCAPAPGRETRALNITPSAIYWIVNALPDSALTLDNARRWLDDLMALAKAAERVPAPANPAEEYAVEQRARVGRGQGALRVALIIIAVWIGISVVCAVPVIAIIAFLATRP